MKLRNDLLIGRLTGLSCSSLEDGQQLYFPTIEEAKQWRESMSVSRSGQIVAQSAGGLININTADEALLCTLPGIGEARARAIVSYRTQRGPFEKPEDIMKVSGIKRRVRFESPRPDGKPSSILLCCFKGVSRAAYVLFFN